SDELDLSPRRSTGDMPAEPRYPAKASRSSPAGQPERDVRIPRALVDLRCTRKCRTMSEHPTPALVEEERRIAHSGALANLAGNFARHPWRVIGGWIAIFVLLGGLNAAFHGTLINDFNIPGSDVQKAT